MDILQLIRTVDGGIAIAVLIWVGYRVEYTFRWMFELQHQTIMTLIDACDDDETIAMALRTYLSKTEPAIEPKTQFPPDARPPGNV